MRLISSFSSTSTRLVRFLTVNSQNRFYAKSSGSSSDKEPSLVIFDKDGTLICFHTMWTPWVTGIARGLEIGTGLSHAGLGHDVFRLLGVSTNTKRVGPGLLAEATMPELKSRLIQLLTLYGFETRCASEILDAVWRENEAQLHADSIAIKPIVPNYPELFRLLRAKNFKIAVCTADSRHSTERTLQYLKIKELIDDVVCGDDPDSRPKPNPYNALKLCRNLGVPPRRTFVVGDTLADLRMGKEAGLVASIGVLSGIGTRDHLAPFANYLIENVGDIAPILMRSHHPDPRPTSREEEEEDMYDYRERTGRRREYSTPFFAYLHSMKALLK